MSFLGFGQSADVTLTLDDAETRKVAKIRGDEGAPETHYLFYDGEAISGTAKVHLKKPGMKLEHQGIRIEFIGQIEVYYDRGNHYDFISLAKDLCRPGELTQSTQFKFDFQNVEKPYESYSGQNVKLRYFLRVTILRRLTDIVREMDLIVHTLCQYPDLNNSIKMEVGIEDCLHIEFEYNRSKYHLRDVIVGKIYFLLVRIKIKHMEIAIIKRETVGSGANTFNENETIAKYEIMDGAPVRGESIPIRLFLAGYELTPTMRDVCKKFSVRYYLNLVLVDEEDRRYFKQQEIVLWRKPDHQVRRAFLADGTPATAEGSKGTCPDIQTGTTRFDAADANKPQTQPEPQPPQQQQQQPDVIGSSQPPPLQPDTDDNDEVDNDDDDSQHPAEQQPAAEQPAALLPQQPPDLVSGTN